MPRKRQRALSHSPDKLPKREFPVDEELDLHGMAVDEAVAATEQLLARHRGKPGNKLRLIHGHSNSAPDSIRKRIRLALDTVWSKRITRYRTDFNNPGATLVEVSGA